jgi:hypothetical protein
MRISVSPINPSIGKISRLLLRSTVGQAAPAPIITRSYQSLIHASPAQTPTMIYNLSAVLLALSASAALIQASPVEVQKRAGGVSAERIGWRKPN